MYFLVQSIHHLKDWVGNDPLSGATKGDGDALIDRTAALQICADLANGTKHLVLTNTRTGDTSTAITKSDVDVKLGVGAAHRFHVESGGSEFDVLVVAKDGVEAWRTFLKDRNLI